MQSLIDREIKKLIDVGSAKATELLTKNRKKLDEVAAALIKKETLEGEEFEALMAERKEKKKTSVNKKTT